MATWSISETTLELRNEIINTLQPDEYLIVYQRQFENISNVKIYRAETENMSFELIETVSTKHCQGMPLLWTIEKERSSVAIFAKITSRQKAKRELL